MFFFRGDAMYYDVVIIFTFADVRKFLVCAKKKKKIHISSQKIHWQQSSSKWTNGQLETCSSFRFNTVGLSLKIFFRRRG